MEVNAQARPSRETIDCKWAQRSRFVDTKKETDSQMLLWSSKFLPLMSHNDYARKSCYTPMMTGETMALALSLYILILISTLLQQPELCCQIGADYL